MGEYMSAIRVSGTVFSRPGTPGTEGQVDWRRIVVLDSLPEWASLLEGAEKAGVNVALRERPVVIRNLLGLFGTTVFMQKQLTLSIVGGNEPSDRPPGPDVHRQNDGRLKELAISIGGLAGVEAQLDPKLTEALVQEYHNPPYREAYVLTPETVNTQ
jgi:hypothetical protein